MTTDYLRNLELRLGNSHIGDWTGKMQHIEAIRRMRQPVQRQQQVAEDGKERSFSDTEKWQFWPRTMAMGSSHGNRFLQMLAVNCEYGQDPSLLDNKLQGKKFGKSYIAFDFRRQLLVIKTRPKDVSPAGLPPALKPLDAELSFEDIASQGIKIDDQRAKGEADMYDVVVTIHTRRPPKFYTEFEPLESGLTSRHRQNLVRRRGTAMDFVTAGATERDAGPIKAIPSGPCAYPTFWNSYRWVFRFDRHTVEKLRQCADKLRLLAEDDQDLDILASGGKTKYWVEKLSAAKYDEQYGEPDMTHIAFAPRCLIEGLIAHGILRPGDVQALVAILNETSKSLAAKCRVLESLYNEERIRNVQKCVLKKARYLQSHPPPALEHLVMIRTVQITPTRVLVGPPQQEASNSVTRRYQDQLDAIIRVQFTDEEDRLFVQEYTKASDNERPNIGVMARIRRALQHGVEIGGRRFMPVASSASQQKDHAIWFIDAKAIDGLELRRWMGNVEEQVVAKHAARMGLPFSTSRIVNLSINLLPNIPDVERNGQCFTDGCAIAGEEVLREAALALGAKGLNVKTSCIQFRLGGAKGVLSYWPGLVGPHDVKMRKSQIKFQSALQDLNVVRLAKYQTAFLNRQFINIMCANGVPEELIVKIFEDAIHKIQGLKGRVMGQKMTKDDQRNLTICSDFPISALIRAGFHRNPMVQDFCDLIECRLLQDIRWRARVRLEGGVFLIGIADESGVLEEGEIFCQYQQDEDTEPTIVTSEVLVCRAPALHPGDIRRAHAVDRPELRHLKNVIVFSVKGERPLPNMLGGGDLDGDDFTIIWDQRFVQSLNVFEAMDYTAPPPVKVPRVTQMHLNENDVLGQVDNMHLALSDIESPFHADALTLSTIHSTAVDFAKTGIAAEIPVSLRKKLTVWPDYMDKDDMKKTYQSKKILGRLFRMVSPDPRFKPCDLEHLNYPTDERIDRFPIFDSIINELKRVKKTYEHGISWDMRRYRVIEPEIPSGIAIKNRHRKRARDQNLNEPLRDSFEQKVREVRAEAEKIISSMRFRSKLPPMLIIARHAYALTYDGKYVREWVNETRREESETRAAHLADKEDGMMDEEDQEELRKRPMTSFAWCFWQELIQLANCEEI